MNEYIDSYAECNGRSVDWKYSGRFLKIGELSYKSPIDGSIRKYECNQRVTKNQQIDGSFALPIIRGSLYTEPHILLISTYRPAIESYTISLPSGLVDKSEDPVAAAIRELKEETGFTGVFIDTHFAIPYYCDPWKSNEQQIIFVIDIDMDLPENQTPCQQLEVTEDIKPIIVPISSMKRYIEDELLKGSTVSSEIYILSFIMNSKDVDEMMQIEMQKLS